MNRTLHILGAALLLFVTVAASYTWPEAIVWVAWLNCLLFWMAANVQVERAKLAEAGRDRWQRYAGRLEGERDGLQKQLANRQADIEPHYYAIYGNYTGQVIGLAENIGDDDGDGLVTYTEITKAQYDEAKAKWDE